MNYKDMFNIVESLPFDTEKIVFSNDNEQIYLLRPSKLSKRFKENYDASKNVQIWLAQKDLKSFKPNHLRILIDLKLRVREHPEFKNEFLEAFDNIFYGMAPLSAISKLQKYTFTQYIGSLETTSILAQLFIIEQNLGYGGRSKYNPSALYIQGWIRTFIDSEDEIDILCRRICNLNPPATKYTCCDDRKHRKYDGKSRPLWYK